MADGVGDGGETGAPGPVVVPGLAAAPRKSKAGWYPDPWARGRHRFWDGQAWTAHSFPNGPAPPDPGEFPLFPPAASPQAASVPPPAPPSATPPPPPEWSDPRADADDTPPVLEPASPPQHAGRRLKLPQGRALLAIVILAGLIVGFSSVGLFYALTGDSRPATPTAAPSTPPTVPPTTPSTTPGAPSTTPGTSPGAQPGGAPGATPGGAGAGADPSASVLSGLVVAQADVPSGVSVQLLPGGNEVSGQPTLDLCNATFPSESLRTARLQVAAVDGLGDAQLSTEAVLYSNTAATAQAFSELKAAAAKCPSGPVPSPAREPTVATHFNPAPDSGWPSVAGVERLAYDFVTTDESGQTQHSVAVYLRRGRVLMGVYFPRPDGAQSAVHGQTSIAGIVNVFATRMAQVPAAAVNGG